MLLDNFIRAVSMEKSKAFELEEQARMMAMGVSKADRANPMEPLLEALSRYKSEVLLPAACQHAHTEHCGQQPLVFREPACAGC